MLDAEEYPADEIADLYYQENQWGHPLARPGQ